VKVWKLCPKCEYERKNSDEGPLGRCPNCDIWYQKYHDRKFGLTPKTHEQLIDDHMENTEKTDIAKAMTITIFLFVVALIAPLAEFFLISDLLDEGEELGDFFTLETNILLLICFILMSKFFHKKLRSKRKFKFTTDYYSMQKGVRKRNY
jgi:hypothetical protein